MVKVTLQQQIEMAIAYSGSVTKKEIAEKINVTPSAFGQRLKTGKFNERRTSKNCFYFGCGIYFSIPI